MVRIATNSPGANMHLLGIDVGGTSTRVVCCDEHARVEGVGAGSGVNPRSAVGDPVENLTLAIRQALGDEPVGVAAVAVGAAGAGTAGREGIVGIVREGLRRAGVDATATVDTDLAVAFRSAAPASNGRLVLAGTGAAAVRYERWRQVRRADGLGWLLGDEGSGAWLGREILRRVAAHLDGRAAPTALTVPVLAHFGIEPTDDDLPQRLVRATDGTRAAHWARLAPLALDRDGDPAASALLDDAARALTIAAETVGGAPTVLAGGLLAVGGLRRRVEERLGPCVFASHPVVGACALAAEQAGVALDRDALTAALAAR